MSAVANRQGRWRAAIGASGLAAALGVGAVISEWGWIVLAALVAGGLFALSLAWAPIFAVISLPAFWLGDRAPLAGGILSLADVFMLAGLGISAIRLDWRQVQLWKLAWPVFFIAAAMLLSVVHVPSVSAFLQWGHRIFLVVASAVIGAYLFQSGRLGLALRLFLLVSVAFALDALLLRAAHPSLPAYPFGLQKNYAGSLLASSALMVILWPGGVAGRLKVRWPLLAVEILGLLVVASHGAMVGFVIALGAAVVLTTKSVGLRFAVVALGVAFAAAVAVAGLVLARAQLSSGQIFGPDITRIDLYRTALAVWQQSPLVGNGLLIRNVYGDPHDVVLLSLEEGGAVELLGFLALIVGSLMATWRSGNQLRLLACSLLVARSVHGLFDVYWVHGSTPVSWLVVGAALGGAALVELALTGAEPSRPTIRALG